MGAARGNRGALTILESYVADFRHDPAAAESITMGIRVTGGVSYVDWAQQDLNL